MLCDAPAGWIGVALGYAGMMATNARDYRRRAKDCCRKAVIVEDIDQRSHWLEAAARWYSLAREEGTLPPEASGTNPPLKSGRN